MSKVFQTVWVFNNQGSRFAGGIFFERLEAEIWIKENKLTGILTLYPVGQGAYEWAIGSGVFVPTQEKEMSPDFIGGFTSASQEHYHYFEGILED